MIEPALANLLAENRALESREREFVQRLCYTSQHHLTERDWHALFVLTEKYFESTCALTLLYEKRLALGEALKRYDQLTMRQRVAAIRHIATR